MSGLELFWTWVAGLLTLCIFSFLYKDNPFYKFAEHVYVGVSAGYWISVNYNGVMKKTLFDSLWQAGHIWATEGRFDVDKCLYVVPLLMGIMLLTRLVPKLVWVSRWPLAFIVGMASGYWIVVTMDASILEQIRATIVHLREPAAATITAVLWTTHLTWDLAGVAAGILGVTLALSGDGAMTARRGVGLAASLLLLGAILLDTLGQVHPVTASTPVDWALTIKNWLVLIGVVSVLTYFYFSKDHTGPVMGTLSRVGIWFLMITFGSAFGYTVMARVSLLIGRMNFLINDFVLGTYHFFFHG